MMRAVLLKSMLAFALVTLGPSFTHFVGAADVQTYKISKGRDYQQAPERVPTNIAVNAFTFEARVLMSEPGSVSGARVKPPKELARTLGPNGNRELRFVNRASRKSVLDDRFPTNGNYKFIIDTQNDGRRSLLLPFIQDGYPSAPFVHHLVELRAVNPNAPLVVSWQRFANGTAGDFIRLRILNSAGNPVWESRSPGEHGALDGTATRALIERGTLRPGNTYSATLLFEKIITRDTNSYPGAVGLTSFFARTRFSIITTSGGPADVERYELSKGRLFEQDDAASAPDPKREDFIFLASIRGRGPGLVTAASLRTTLESNLVLVADAGRTNFAFSQTTSTRTNFEALFPPGNYVFDDLETLTQGTRTVGLWFGTDNFPPAPNLIFDPAQEVSRDAPVIVSWQPWTSGTRDDFIRFRVEDKAGQTLFETPDFDDPNALDGRATSVTIPVGILQRAHEHKGFLTFRRFDRFNWFDYPGALGVSSIYATTEFDIQTIRPDLEEYSIERGRGFRQVGDNAPTPDPNDEFQFNAHVQASSSNAISSATLITPLNATIPMVQIDPNEFEFSDKATNEPAFNALYPAGTYTFNIEGRQGPVSVGLNVPDIPYPPAPHPHLRALGNPEADVPVTLTWDPWIGGTTNDFIRVRIQDDDGVTLWQTPGRGDEGALDGLATSVPIPAGTFRVAEDFEGRITFRRFVVENESPFPGAEGSANYFSRTDFDIESARPDVEDYRIERGRRFDQTSADPPLPDLNDEHEFNVLVRGSAENLISSVTLRTPPGAIVVLDPNDEFDEFEFTDDTVTLDEYNNLYPSGIYTFTVQSVNDGEQAINLPVPPNDFPPAPYLVFDPRTPVPANRPFVLQWRPWEGGTTDDLIRLRIETADGDLVYETAGRGGNNHLNGLATSVTIPAGTLTNGQTYEGQLVFDRLALSDKITLPGAEGRVTYFGRTDFPIVGTLADVEDYRIERGRRFEQATAGSPVSDPDGEFEFNAEVQGAAPAFILSASLSTPPGGVVALEPNNDFDEFEFSDRVTTQAEFDTLYPVGTYNFTVQSVNQGTQLIGLEVPASDFPPAPHIQFDPRTIVPADQPLVLSWDAWVGGTTNDFIQLRVEDDHDNVVFETPDRGKVGAFDGFGTSTNIPAGGLVPGETYKARLVFERIVLTNETGGAQGRVTYFARTDFTIETIPGDVEDYRIERGRRFEQTTLGFPVPDPGNEFQFHAEVQASASNQISSAVLRTALGADIVLEPDNDRDEFEFTDHVSLQTEFDNLYPGGRYTFTVQGVNQGTQSFSLNVPVSDYPPSPHVLFDPRAEVSTNQDLVLIWDSWFDGNANDFIQFRIEDAANKVVFETPGRGDDGALNGFATSVTIPAGILVSAQRYEGQLVFERIVLADETTVPGAEGRVIHFARTDFDIETTGGDVEDYRIERGRRFEQTTAGLPSPDPGDEFEFNAKVQGSESNIISSANLRTPPGAVIVLDPNNDRDEFEFSDQVSTQAEFDAQYPPGAYNFIVQSVNQGTQTILLNVPASEYPPAPHVQSDPATPVPANQLLLISWDAWVGGTVDDFVRLRIEDADNNVIFETPGRGDFGALTGLSTSEIIPLGILAPGRTYEGRLVFERIVLKDETGVPGAEGRVTYFARTDFDIKTLPPDVREYDVFKEHVYVQTSNGPPAATEFVFRAVVQAESDFSVFAAAISTPLGNTEPLLPNASGDQFEFRASFDSQEALDALYLDGEYTLIVSAINDGTHFIPVMITNAMYPSAPQLSNYDAAQNINPAAAFVLAWDPFSDGTAQDHIDVQIKDFGGSDVFNTPGHGKPGALDGFATSVTIPPFTLQPADVYETRLLFQKILRADDSGYAGAAGRVGYSARTFVSVATAAAANPPPLIQNHQALPDGSLQFKVSTLQGVTYQIQGSPNMIDWTTLGTISATSGLSTFTVPPPPSTGCYFYRVVLMQ